MLELEHDLEKLIPAKSFMGKLAGWGDGIESLLYQVVEEFVALDGETTALRTDLDAHREVSSQEFSWETSASDLLSLVQSVEGVKEEIQQIFDRQEELVVKIESVQALAEAAHSAIADLSEAVEGETLTSPVVQDQIKAIQELRQTGRENRTAASLADRVIRRLERRVDMLERRSGETPRRATLSIRQVIESVKVSRQRVVALIDEGVLEDKSCRRSKTTPRAICVESLRRAIADGKLVCRKGVKL